MNEAREAKSQDRKESFVLTTRLGLLVVVPLALVLGAQGVSWAVVNLPKLWTAGETLTAADLNANFAALADAIEAGQPQRSVLVSDSAGLAAALAAAETGQLQDILLEPGSYTLAAADSTIYGPVRIRGAGAGRTDLSVTGSQTLTTVGQLPGIEVALEDLTVYEAVSCNAGVLSLRDVTVQTVVPLGMAGTAVNATSCNTLKISHSSIYVTGGADVSGIVGVNMDVRDSQVEIGIHTASGRGIHAVGPTESNIHTTSITVTGAGPSTGVSADDGILNVLTSRILIASGQTAATATGGSGKVNLAMTQISSGATMTPVVVSCFSLFDENAQPFACP